MDNLAEVVPQVLCNICSVYTLQYYDPHLPSHGSTYASSQLTAYMTQLPGFYDFYPHSEGQG
jgi:hypothetical protein